MGKFEMSAKMSLAVSRVMESDPKDWSSVEHGAMIRYLALECSKQSKAVAGEVLNEDGKTKLKGLVLEGKLVHTIEVDWLMFRDEINRSAKICECANLKKHLSEDYEQFRTAVARKNEYA